MTDEYTFFKYNQAANPDDIGRFMVYKSNPQAYWFDDYTDLVDEGRLGGSDLFDAGTADAGIAGMPGETGGSPGVL
jgi:lysine 2,3-aminomutase